MFHSEGWHSSSVVMAVFFSVYGDTAENGGIAGCLSFLSVDIEQYLECTSHNDFSFNYCCPVKLK